MKKETVLTALVFLVVGFLAGYITDAQLNWNARQKSAVTAGPPAETQGGGGSPASGLPEGHPPIDADTIVAQLEQMAAKNPKDGELRLKLANFLYDQKQYARAIEWYQRALELEPRNVNARTDLGTSYFYTGRPQEALQQYSQSLQIDPRHEPTLLNMVVVNLEGAHDLAAAQAAWDRLRKVNPNHPALESLKEKLDAARASGRSTPAPQ